MMNPIELGKRAAEELERLRLEHERLRADLLARKAELAPLNQAVEDAKIRLAEAQKAAIGGKASYTELLQQVTAAKRAVESGKVLAQPIFQQSREFGASRPVEKPYKVWP